MKYIIHIGQSKTGTSSLQSFLAMNRKRLVLQGFLFPDVYINSTALNIVDHNALADRLGGVGRVFFPGLSSEEYFQHFEEQARAQNCHTIILSAESFFGAPQIWRVSDEEHFWQAHKNKVSELSRFMEGHDVQIIGYLRHQADWFESAASHIIRMEGLLEHDVYESDEQLFEYLRPHMDYMRILDLWRSAFSSEAMNVLIFDKNRFKNQSIIDDFCDQISLKKEGLETPQKQKNVGMDRRYVWLKEQLNKKKGSKAKERVTIALLEDLSNRVENKKKRQILPEIRTGINKYYASLNEGLCRAYFVEMPNVLTQPREADWRGEITEEEKQDARKSFKSALYSPRALYLYVRYSAGAFLRQYAPGVNNLIKRVIG